MPVMPTRGRIGTTSWVGGTPQTALSMQGACRSQPTYRTGIEYRLRAGHGLLSKSELAGFDSLATCRKDAKSPTANARKGLIRKCDPPVSTDWLRPGDETPPCRYADSTKRD